MKTISIVCPRCEIAFETTSSRYNSNNKRGRRSFCSQACRNAQVSEELRTRPKFVTVTCKNCQISVEKERNNAGRGLFCSISCAQHYRHKIAGPIRTWTCVACGQETTRRRKYCEVCVPIRTLAGPGEASGKSGRVIGKHRYLPVHNQTITIGELRDKYSTHQFHAKVRGWARTNYGWSGSPMVCYVCAYDTYVEICHIRPIKDFPPTATISEVNHPDNLVALCRNHHWEFDHGHITL